MILMAFCSVFIAVGLLTSCSLYWLQAGACRCIFYAMKLCHDVSCGLGTFIHNDLRLYVCLSVCVCVCVVRAIS